MNSGNSLTHWCHETIECLATALEVNDVYIKEHSKHGLGKWLGLDGDELEELHFWLRIFTISGKLVSRIGF